VPRQQIEVFNLSCDVAAADFSVAPVMTLAAKIPDFGDFFDLMGLTLTSSLLNFSTTNPVGVFVIIGKSNAKLTFSRSLICPMPHVTLQNSYAGPPVTPVPTTKTTPKSFSKPFPITPKMPISIYVYGDNTANNRATAFLALEMTRSARH
jgi:hypothetical protein